MKKIILFIVAIIAIAISNIDAQTYVTTSSNNTITNSGSSYALTGALNNSYQWVSVQSIVTSVSGTVGGNGYLQASNDGTNYKTVVATGIDTFALSNTASQTHIWEIPNAPYKYYRVAFTGTGTMVATHTGLFLPRK